MVWQESWAHPHAFGLQAIDAAALIALLIELHSIIQEYLTGFGLDYVKCFDSIPQRVHTLYSCDSTESGRCCIGSIPSPLAIKET